MKAYKNIVYTLMGLSFLFGGSCTTKFEEINTDPNRPTSVLTHALLTRVQREIAYNYYDTWQGLRMNGVIGQQWGQRTYTEEDRYSFAARTSTVANFFNLTYLYTENLNQIIYAIAKDPDGTAVFGDNKLQIASAKIIRAWLIFQNVQTFGDVPYTEANDITNTTPKYDTQEFIFKDLIRELKEINTSLQGVTRGWTIGDNLLGGNPEKWRRFANSLRLRIAIGMSNIEPTLSATEAAAAIADGVMRDNGDNATFRFLSMGAPNENSKYTSYVSRMDFLPSWQFVNLLHGRDDDNIGFKNPFNGIYDPRHVQFVQSPADQRAGLPARVDSPPIGLNNSDNDQVWASLSTVTRITYGPTSGRVDDVLPKPIQASFWSTMLDFPNVAFLVAERQNNDRSFFEKGVQASLEIWGVPVASATTYLTAVMAKFDAANAEGRYEMIITQKYIHNFGHLDQESVFEYRRTEYPKSIVLPGQRSGGTYTIGGAARTFTFQPFEGTIFMQRHYYPTSENSFNKEKIKEAVKSIGGEGDTQSTPLYYSKKYKK